MTREEFLEGFQRLCRGHGHKATDERAEATFRAVSRWQWAAWERAIDKLLLEPRPPTGSQLLSALEKAAEEIHRETPSRLDFARYLPGQLSDGAPNRDYGQARLDLAKALFRGKITKREAADQLLDLADRFPAMAGTLVREAAWFADQVSGTGPSLSPEADPRGIGPAEPEAPPSAC